MTLSVLIVDDEELARLRLRSLLDDCSDPTAQVVGEAAHAPAAVQWLREHRADVALLDVQMPGADGVALAMTLRDIAPQMAVIFVTAHAEHAVQAFELEAVDYLTKPVRRERLQAALQRAARRLGQAETEPSPLVEAEALLVHDRGRLLRVPVGEALYFKAELKYVTLRTATHSYVLDESLSELEQRLGPGFVRVHRNALVARRAMRALERRPDEDDGSEGWALQVSPTNEWLAVSRRQVPAVKEALAGRR
jgi:two-component system response regulator AlgR